MAYGLSVINAVGDEVFDTENQMMSLMPQGVCALLSSATVPVYARAGYPDPIASSAPISEQYIAPSFEAGVNSAGDPVVVPYAAYTKTDFGFIELPAAGIFMARAINQRDAQYTSGTLFAYIAAASIPAMRHVVATTAPGTPSGSYGLQLFDSTGAVIFDSRHKKLGIQDTIFISRAQFQNVMWNNAVINFTLSAPTPNCLIYMPFWINAQYITGTPGGVTTVKLTQINSTMLQISRFVDNPFGVFNPFNFEYYHDAVVVVARNILI